MFYDCFYCAALDLPPAFDIGEGDPIPLTTGHFLIGSEITARPEPFIEIDLTVSYKSRWLEISAIRDHFWQRWRKETLNQLHQRKKWQFLEI